MCGSWLLPGIKSSTGQVAALRLCRRLVLQNRLLRSGSPADSNLRLFIVEASENRTLEDPLLASAPLPEGAVELRHRRAGERLDRFFGGRTAAEPLHHLRDARPAVA